MPALVCRPVWCFTPDLQSGNEPHRQLGDQLPRLWTVCSSWMARLEEAVARASLAL